MLVMFGPIQISISFKGGKTVRPCMVASNMTGRTHSHFYTFHIISYPVSTRKHTRPTFPRWSEAECERAALSVTGTNQRKLLGPALSLIRFPLMTVEEFAQGPAQSGILTDREVVQLFLHFTVSLCCSAWFTHHVHFYLKNYPILNSL